jgi:carbamoyl-phosphate synthase large subunit
MAIGRTFPEVIQKAVRMLDIGVLGPRPRRFKFDDLEDELKNADAAGRVFAFAKALRDGMTVDEVHDMTGSIAGSCTGCARSSDAQGAEGERGCRSAPRRCEGEAARLLRSGSGQADGHGSCAEIRAAPAGTRDPAPRRADRHPRRRVPGRDELPLLHVPRDEDEVAPSWRKKILVLGSGAYRIGSSVEFDWCCVNAVQAASELGYETIMLNYNPETVSTDYDMCDKLIFDEVSFETVLDIYEREQPDGVVVRWAARCRTTSPSAPPAGVRILGTSGRASTRPRTARSSRALLDELGIDQPKWAHLTTPDARPLVEHLGGFPVLVRPSYVLSGAAMSVAHEPHELQRILERAQGVSPEHPVVISKFEVNAREIEIDAVADNGEMVLWAISEHIEDAGVHSGDATLMLPPQTSTCRPSTR